MSDVENEFSELVDSILEHGPPYNEMERVVLAVFGPRIPDWEGTAIPKLEVFRKYLQAVKISEKLFGNSDRFDIDYFNPKPFSDYCGMAIYVKADDMRAVVAVFQDEDSVKSVRELVDLADSISVDAELLLNGKPRLCLAWYIDDPFIGNPDKGQ